MKKLFFYIAFALGLASCSSAENEDLISAPQESPEVSNDHRVTQAEAINLAMSFKNGSKGTVLSRSEESDASDVENVVVVRWEDIYPGVPNPVINGDDPVSRGRVSGLDARPMPVDTLFYVVNNKNNAGYTVVAADDRTDPIYIVIDKGNYHAGDWNSAKLGDGCVQVVDRAVELIVHDMGLEISVYRKDSIDNSNLQVILPMLKTAWGAYSPMGLNANIDLPDSVGFEKSERNTLAVAVAQILSYKSITPQNYPNELNWDLILSEYTGKNNPGLPTSDKTKKQVADLINYLSLSLENENWVDSLAESDNAEIVSWFANQNLTISGFEYCNMDKALKDIKYGHLLCVSILTQSIGSLERRYLVMDGYDSKFYTEYSYPIGRRRESNLPHCNWGLNGNFNGYFLARLFDETYFDRTENNKDLPYKFSFKGCRYARINDQ